MCRHIPLLCEHEFIDFGVCIQKCCTHEDLHFREWSLSLHPHLCPTSRQLQSQNRQLKLYVSALTLRTPLIKEQRLASPSPTPTKSCPPPSAWLSPGKVHQAHLRRDAAAVKSHVQAPLFSGSGAGSASTGKIPDRSIDRSDGSALADAQLSVPAASSKPTPSPAPPPNTPETEAAAAPRLTPVRIQLLDQLLDLEEGEDEHGVRAYCDSRSFSTNQPMFSYKRKHDRLISCFDVM